MLLLVAGLAGTGLAHEAIRLTTMRPAWFIATHAPEFAMQEARETSETLRDEVAQFYRDRGRFPEHGDASVGLRIVHPRAHYFRSFTLQPNGRIVFELNDQQLDADVFELQAVDVGDPELRWGCLRDLRPYREDGCRHPDIVRAEGRS